MSGQTNLAHRFRRRARSAGTRPGRRTARDRPPYTLHVAPRTSRASSTVPSLNASGHALVAERRFAAGSPARRSRNTDRLGRPHAQRRRCEELTAEICPDGRSFASLCPLPESEDVAEITPASSCVVPPVTTAGGQRPTQSKTADGSRYSRWTSSAESPRSYTSNCRTTVEPPRVSVLVALFVFGGGAQAAVAISWPLTYAFSVTPNPTRKCQKARLCHD